MFQRICLRLQVWPTLDTFVSKGSHQIPKYMTWDQDSRAVAINTLDYYCDPAAWLLPLVPHIPLALERVKQQQIKEILICPEWTGAMWWPQLVKLRTEMALICLPASANCLRFCKGSTDELPLMDPVYTFHIREKGVIVQWWQS